MTFTNTFILAAELSDRCILLPALLNQQSDKALFIRLTAFAA
ncbi:hypothetical protein [Hymenobacter psoromatis]|nr:hypothetical protein [Hymenobacter psoromatis]